MDSRIVKVGMRYVPQIKLYDKWHGIDKNYSLWQSIGYIMQFCRTWRKSTAQQRIDDYIALTKEQIMYVVSVYDENTDTWASGLPINSYEIAVTFCVIGMEDYHSNGIPVYYHICEV